jgi:GH24 family phage-related lysozyme (muramidase)
VNSAQTRALIQKHEGLRLTAYNDSRGILTIGYGFNLEQVAAPNICMEVGISYTAASTGTPITQQQADSLFEKAYEQAVEDADNSLKNGIASLADDAAAALVDMAYNLGFSKLNGFQHMLAALDDLDYTAAAFAAENSLWYTQVGIRGTDDVALFKLAAVQPNGGQ